MIEHTFIAEWRLIALPLALTIGVVGAALAFALA
jgi:hypothetical protein